MRALRHVPVVLLGFQISAASATADPLNTLLDPLEKYVETENISPARPEAQLDSSIDSEELQQQQPDDLLRPVEGSETVESAGTAESAAGIAALDASTFGLQEEQPGDVAFSRYWTLGYAAIFYGPALENPSGYQPQPSGSPDLSRPVQLRNYAHLSYAVTEDLALTGTVYWLWQAPNSDHLSLQDPQFRVSLNRIINTDVWNLYADARFHFPISNASHANDLRGGVQLFQALSFDVPSTSLTANLYVSERYNFFGRSGIGNDFELYVAPNLTFQAFPTLAFSLTVESGASHLFGDTHGLLGSDGTDIEPGVIWDIAPNLSFNPYLNFYPNAISARNTMIGATLNWTIF